MAEWRTSNPSNKPETCLWCGRKLRRKMQAFDKDGKYLKPKDRTEPAYDAGGSYGDGYFCGLRCGYLFGEQMAKFGRRIAPRGEKA